MVRALVVLETHRTKQYRYFKHVVINRMFLTINLMALIFHWISDCRSLILIKFSGLFFYPSKRMTMFNPIEMALLLECERSYNVSDRMEAGQKTEEFKR